jgi:hypothetical protein
MKTYKHILAIVVIFVVVSCSKDSQVSYDPELVAGTWEMTGFDYTGTTTSTIQGNTTSSDFSGVGTRMDMVLALGHNPNTWVSSGSYDIELTWEIQGSEFRQAYPFSNFVNNGSWSIEGNQLNVFENDGDAQQRLTIISVTSNTLELETETELDFSQSGLTALTVVNVHSVYTKK